MYFSKGHDKMIHTAAYLPQDNKTLAAETLVRFGSAAVSAFMLCCLCCCIDTGGR